VFEFGDPIGIPRPAQRNGDPFVQEVTIQPQPGLMVLFPSTLRHRLEPSHIAETAAELLWPGISFIPTFISQYRQGRE